MAVKKVLNVRDPRLRQVAKPVSRVDKRVKKLLQNLEDTLRTQSDPEGVGLAAPQIGVFLRVFVMRHKGKVLPLINPEIVKLSKKTNDPKSDIRYQKSDIGHPKSDNRQPETEYIMEGCLSLPHYYGPVRRSWSIELRYMKSDGQTKMQKFTGFPAQIIQHEIDHLNGKLFIDRLFAQKRQFFELKNEKWQEVDLP